MDEQFSDLIKQRDISFCTLAKDPKPAYSAALLLDGLDGVLRIAPQSTHLLTVEFSIHLVTLRLLHQVLTEVGFHLDNSVLYKIKNALYHYTEETQLANLGHVQGDSKSTTQIFINSYLQKTHGCQDERPHYFHRYY
jgi:hypothetical protein